MNADGKGDVGGQLQCESVARAALGEPPKRAGADLLWRCPNHDDEHPSLSVNPQKNVWFCGPCGASGNAWQFAAFLAKVCVDDKPAVKKWLVDHGLLSKRASGNGKRTGAGLTLAHYAEAKRLPVEFLRGLGVEEIQNHGEPALKIIYRLEDGSLAPRQRIRTALRAKEGSYWDNGKGEILPYGLDRLPEVRERGYIVLIEGESDTQTLWFHGEPALGIPGAVTFKNEWAAYLDGIPKIFALVEPDRGGEAFRAKLAQSTLRDKLSFVLLPTKDVSALHIENADTFDARLAEAKARAVSATQDGAVLIREAEELFGRYIVAPSGTPLITSLYAAMTHVFQAFGWIGYLAFCSPLEECGKSRAASIVGWFSHDFEIVVNASGPALYRTIEARHPTIVIDEAELLQGDTETAQVWAAANATRIGEVYESLPDSSLDGRDAENLAPLEAVLRVADPSRLAEFNAVRETLIGSRQKAAAGGSAGVRLLADIRAIFAERKVAEMPSSELADALAKIETSPWGEDSRGKPLSAAKLAGALKPFQIRPDRIGGKDSQARGYVLAWFQEAFTCYLPPQTVNPSTTRENSGDGEGFKPSTESLVDTLKNATPANKNAADGHVDTFKSGIEAEEAPSGATQEVDL